MYGRYWEGTVAGREERKREKEEVSESPARDSR